MMSHTIAHLTKNFKTLLMSHKSWLYASYFANFRSRGQTLPVSKSSTWSRAANNRSRFKVDIWIEWRFWWVTTHWTMLFLEVFAIDTQLLHWSFILDFLLGRHLSKSVLLDSIEKISSKTKKSLLCNHSHLLSSSRHLLGWPKPDHADQRIEFRFELWKKLFEKKSNENFLLCRFWVTALWDAYRFSGPDWVTLESTKNNRVKLFAGFSEPVGRVD